jgi:hypothetical protein
MVPWKTSFAGLSLLDLTQEHTQCEKHFACGICQKQLEEND